MNPVPVSPELARILRCPSCYAPGLELLQSGGDGMRCGACGHVYPRAGGVLDLVAGGPAGAADAVPSPAQRLMQLAPFAAIYERWWRPLALRALGSPGRDAEEFVFKRALGVGDRPGPWLDLSCGPANVARAIAHATGDAVVGVDLSWAMLRQAAARASVLPNLHLVRGDATSLPFADSVLGGCVNSLALHLYPDAGRVFGEVHRVLRPGGAYTATTLRGTGVPAVDALIDAGGVHVWDEEGLRAALARTGFVGYDAMRTNALVLFRVHKP